MNGQFQSKPSGSNGTDQTMTPELTAIIDDLAKICGAAMEDGEVLDQDEMERLVESLATNGWERHSQDLPPISTVIETRTREIAKEPAIHRGGELEALCRRIQESYNKVSRYRSSTPESSKPASEDASSQPMPPRTGIQS